MIISRGNVLPFGASICGDGINFSLYSKSADRCVLVLFHRGDEDPFARVNISDYKYNDIFAVYVEGISEYDLEYGYILDGKHSENNRFSDKIMLDPYSKRINGNKTWKRLSYENYRLRSAFPVPGRFNWEGDSAPDVDVTDLIIYEMHVRGFTENRNSNVRNRGTYLGIIEKIPYLKDLGINCLELMPVMERDENICFEGREYTDFWGYSPLGYFCPKQSYACRDSVYEFCKMVKALHENGIKIIIDVVFNHTGEYGDNDDNISFAGIDTPTWYHMRDGKYIDRTGCEDTVNCNEPYVRNFILDVLRYWVSEFHVDGFRFDEFPVLAIMPNLDINFDSPLIREIREDPVINRCILISEGFDAYGDRTTGKAVGFCDWIPEYGESVKRTVNGKLDERIKNHFEGSPDTVYAPIYSVNYLSSHDGITLYDSFSYNVWNNENSIIVKNGTNDFMDNSGIEGETNNKEINKLRHSKIKMCAMFLLLSRGIPMISAGDEGGRTQKGMNDAFDQDNEINWFDWDRLNSFDDVYAVYKFMIDFRHKHPVITRRDFYTGVNQSGYPELSWHGTSAWNCNLSLGKFAILYVEPDKDFHTGRNSFIYCAFNSRQDEDMFELPIVPEGYYFRELLNTGYCPYKIVNGKVHVPGNSASLLVAEKNS